MRSSVLFALASAVAVSQAAPVVTPPALSEGAVPTAEPTGLALPSIQLPSGFPTALPSGFPTALPSGFPALPTGISLPTALPSGLPTALPSDFEFPTALPSSFPTAFPSGFGGGFFPPGGAAPTGSPSFPRPSGAAGSGFPNIDFGAALERADEFIHTLMEKIEKKKAEAETEAPTATLETRQANITVEELNSNFEKWIKELLGMVEADPGLIPTPSGASLEPVPDPTATVAAEVLVSSTGTAEAALPTGQLEDGTSIEDFLAKIESMIQGLLDMFGDGQTLDPSAIPAEIPSASASALPVAAPSASALIPSPIPEASSEDVGSYTTPVEDATIG